MVSIASGMPWPRILSDPNRAIRPTINPPMTGMATTRSALRPAIIAEANEKLPYQKTLVAKRDELEQRPGAECSAGAGDGRHRGENEHPVIGAVIGEASRMV